jgi:hypothetical protein
MNSNLYEDKFARALRTSKATLVRLADDLAKTTGKFGVIERLFFDSERIVGEKLAALGVPHEASAQEVYDALVSRVEADDITLLKTVGHSSLRGAEASRAVVRFIVRAYRGNKRGLFLKKDVIRKFLLSEPPRQIMAALGYGTAEELLAKEDLLEVASALRIVESEEWQNTVFFKHYAHLTPSDFENRDIEVRALSEKWARLAQKFVAKKYHNVSHLKELGVIFVIPIFLGISGETVRLMSLLLHYYHEVSYYAGIFKLFAERKQDFAKNIQSVLRGDVLPIAAWKGVPEAARPRFLVIQRYLAKLDEADPRLAEPHVNPEALHWMRAEADIAALDHESGLDFWADTGWVSDFFKTDLGDESLMSFNLGDLAMTLVKQKTIRYTYHAQEALWNRIFTEYYGVEALERLTQENIVKGYFEV